MRQKQKGKELFSYNPFKYIKDMLANRDDDVKAKLLKILIHHMTIAKESNRKLKDSKDPSFDDMRLFELDIQNMIDTLPEE